MRLSSAALLLPVLLSVSLASAQTTLESFDFPDVTSDASSSAGSAAPSPGGRLADCLVDGGAACGEARSARPVTLEDLVNYDVIDNEAAERASPSAADGASAGANEVARSAPLPSIDVEILFALDSDSPLPSEWQKIVALAEAVSDPRLEGARFVLIGHTDATGSDRYNLALSERRARAIRDRLVTAGGLSPDRFLVVGRGERDLAVPWDPAAAVNRRVQVVVLDR